MENFENNKLKGSFLKRLFRYFNSLLVIDKSIDFILIFVGLLAALGVESYQKSKEIESRYIDMLARTYDEIQINKYALNERDKSIKGFLSILNEINDLASTASYEYYDGVNKLIVLENSLFDIKVYQSLSAEEFLNKTIYSEVLHLYDLLSQFSKEMDMPRNNLKKYNYNYYRLFVKSEYKSNNIINEYIEHNYDYNLIINSLPNLQTLLLDIEMTSERVLKTIENELDKYNTQLINKRGLSNYISLAIAANGAKDFDDAILYSNAGLKLIENSKNDTLNEDYFENKTYFGRFNKQLFQSKMLLSMDGDLTYSKDEIKQNLDSFHSSGFATETSQIFYLEFYYKIDKNLEEFLSNLDKYIKNYPDCNELKSWIHNYPDFTSENQVIELLDQSLKEGQNWRDWVDLINR